MQLRTRSILAAALALLALGCGASDADPAVEPATDAETPDFRPDLGLEELDLGPDVRKMPDIGPDLAPDGPIGPDAAPDAALDAAPAVDASLDSAADAAAPDLALDAAPDLALDATPDLAPDGPPPPPREGCFGGEDEDGDGLIDCADPDCRQAAACFEAREDCANGVDDDGDLRADCDDRYCLADPDCPPPDVEPYTTDDLQARFDFECAHCHGPVDPFSSLDLSAPFEDAVVDVQSIQVPLPLIKPGARDESFLYLKITFHHLDVGGDGEGMPPAFEGYLPWSAEEAERLGRWIEGLGSN